MIKILTICFLLCLLSSIILISPDNSSSWPCFSCWDCECWDLGAEYINCFQQPPSYGFSGGPYLCHWDSAYVDSFWNAVDAAFWYFGGSAVNSGYRCPVHNADIGGEQASYHTYGCAADIQTNNYQTSLNWVNSGWFDYGYVYTSHKAHHVNDYHY